MTVILVPYKTGDQVFNDIELIIFDKDGTLIELHEYWVSLSELRVDAISQYIKLNTEQRIKLLRSLGIDIFNRKLLEEGPTGIHSRDKVIASATKYLETICHKDTYDLCKLSFEKIDRIPTSVIKEMIIPIPGSVELTKLLGSKRCKTAIATTDKYSRALYSVKEHDYHIDVIASVDNIKTPKPDPEIIYYILDKLAIDKSKTLVIGDTTTDLKCGNDAGVRATIGVLTGQTPRKELEKHTPYVINSINDIMVH